MKLINHVLDIRRLIQQAFDNRFSRMGLRVKEPIPVEQLATDQQQRRRHTVAGASAGIEPCLLSSFLKSQHGFKRF